MFFKLVVCFFNLSDQILDVKLKFSPNDVADLKPQYLNDATQLIIPQRNIIEDDAT